MEANTAIQEKAPIGPGGAAGLPSSLGVSTTVDLVITSDRLRPVSSPVHLRQNLAVLHHKLAERVAQLEQELTRLGQEHQDLKRVVGRKLM